MKTVLILSSQVSASHVGGGAAQFCLRSLGIETVLLPTTLFGRHPGWGSPGGTVTPTATLRSMWDGIRDQTLHFDAILTGYMGEVGHIQFAQDTITELRTRNENLLVVVDPVMGDAPKHGHNGLYIPKDRADLICQNLVPLADLITPNLWENEYIKTQNLTLAPKAKLVTSALNPKGEIGAKYQDKQGAWQIHHRRFEQTPHGSGDCLAALFLGHLLHEQTPPQALEKALSSVFGLLEMAQTRKMTELPLIKCADALTSPSTFKSTRA